MQSERGHSQADAASDSALGRFICGIGVATASLDALVTLFGLIERVDLAFVIVQRPPGVHPSRVVDMLARVARAPVRVAKHGARVEPGVILVTPPSSDVAILHGVLHLMPAPAVGVPRQPVDLFFRSLAIETCSRAIGVVLDHTLPHGASGLRAIEADGGVTLVQASAPDRPAARPQGAAVDDAAHDARGLSVADIAEAIQRLAAHPTAAASAGPVPAGEGLARLMVLLRSVFDSDLTYYKRSTIERRLERRMAQLRIARVDDYVRYAHANPSELAALHRDVLINVTGFFRDGAPFDALQTHVLPAILAGKQPGDTIRFWTPACSTGEEAYSVAMCLIEHLGDRSGDYRIQGFGTDLDARSVQRARSGVYAASEMVGVSPEHVERYFVARDGGFQVTRALRETLVFAVQNVARDAPFSRIDLVTCRNMLIYMQPALQRQVLKLLRYALLPGGFLMLGTSETVGDLPEHFALVDRRSKIYAKRASTVPTPEIMFTPLGSTPRRPSHNVDVPGAASPQQLADRKVIERFGPPGLLLDENLDIIQYRGRTGPYLDPSPGSASLNVLRNVRPELRSDLRDLLRRALGHDAPVVSEAIRIGADGEPTKLIDLEVIPIDGAEQPGSCLLVLFKAHDDERPREPDRRATADTLSVVDARIAELERELALTREHLQATIEDLETTNEELKSTVEELQASNEELQATNEELETSKEEVQSTNEELTTINDELQARMVELSSSNDDLANVLVGLDAAVLFVGLDLRLRRFSYAAERTLRLVPSDIGRPVSHLSAFLGGLDLERAIVDVLSRMSPREEDVVTPDGWYVLRVVPFKGADHTLRGAMLVLVDVDDHRASIAAADDRPHRTLLRGARSPAIALNEHLRVVWASAGFSSMSALPTAEVLGRDLAEIADGAWYNVALEDLVAVSLAGGPGERQRALVVVGAPNGPRAMVASAALVTSARGRQGRRIVLITFEDPPPSVAPAGA